MALDLSRLDNPPIEKGDVAEVPAATAPPRPVTPVTTPRRPPASTPAGGPARSVARWLDGAPGLRRRVSVDDLVVFTRQLSLLLQTGNGLVPSVEALSTQIQSATFRRVLDDIQLHLKEGTPFSGCLSRHPEVFDQLFVSLVRAGEASGQIRESIERLTGVLETRRRLRTRVREAMAYPLVLLVITGIVLTVMFTFMLPRFANLFGSMGAELPAITRALLALSDFVSSRWMWLLPIPGVIAVSARRLGRVASVSRAIDELKLRLPLVRSLYTEAYLFQMFLSLGLLIRSRVPLLEAITITRGTVGNRQYRTFFDRLSEHVEHGRGVASAFSQASFLPDTVKLMITTGEAAGALDRVMVRLSDRYQEDLESDIRRLSSAIEPFMLVIMGIVVGIVAISLILPLFKLSRALH